MNTARNPDDQPLLSLNGLGKSFDPFHLEDLDLEVRAGQVVGLVGANGAGKTTAIGCALGMLRPDRGTVHLIDKQWIGVVLDTPPYLPTWTVAEVELALAPFYPRWNRSTFARLADRAGLSTSSQVGSLSRGMALRLQLAVALSHDARLLILDEPTSGVDPVGRCELLDELAGFMLHEDHGILFSTHITADLERIADRVVVLAHGRMVAAGDTPEILDAFRMVHGGLGELPDPLRGMVHGLREHSVGWAGVMATPDTVHLSGACVVEEPTLDELVRHLSSLDAPVASHG
ncbi:ABC transporter ATP-binding protein [Austwickia chelonae]|uniref:ABC transporter ATP-binding protein n=1 Tax=Austwickia chelonae TaxID=100225 RepID=UPI000E25D46B|nr:ABC transporter ATP-binding protein [Austwickia chelonae]